MKKVLFLLCVLCASFAVCLPTSGQKYNAKTDTIWGAYCYYDYQGHPDGSTRQKRALMGWPSRRTTKLAYYVKMPKGTVRADMNVTGKSGRKPVIDLVLTKASTGDTILVNSATATIPGAANKIEIMPATEIDEDTWYRFEISCANGTNTVHSITNYVFQRTSTSAVGASEIFMAPSVHLWTVGSSDINAPSGAAYDWCYQEVLVPVSEELVDTYVMSLGVLHGYMGIQSVRPSGATDYYSRFNHNVLFSMWDNGDMDVDPNLPDYLRSGALDAGDNVQINHFHGEGTGAQAMMSKGDYWQPGNWVQFICTARPEDVYVTIKNADGTQKVIEYQNTLVTAWYKMAHEKEWHYIATLRESGANHYFAGWYSFIENFTDVGGNFKRRAYFRNNYMRALTDGKWYCVNSFTYGHTQGNGSRFSRTDYGHGATDAFENCFYLETGGYGNPNDSVNNVPLPLDNTCVDTINLNALLQQVDAAIVRDKYSEISSRLSAATNIDDLKALAATIISEANQFNGYSMDDLGRLIAIFDDGKCSDAATLRDAIKQVGQKSMPLKCSTVSRKENLGTYRAYQLANVAGRGVVAGTTADDVKMLTLRGATLQQAASEDYKAVVDVTDNTNNWILVHSMSLKAYYLYNIGLGMYLDLSKGTLLNVLPTKVDVTKSGDGFTFKQNGNYLSANPMSATNPVSRTTQSSDALVIFKMIDNISMQPSQAVGDSLLRVVEDYERVAACVSSVNTQLSLTNNTVGYIVNESDREAIKRLYNGGAFDDEQFVQLVDLLGSVERLEFQPETQLYRIRTVNRSNSAPYMTVNNDYTLLNKAATNKPDQVWRFIPDAKGGYYASTQGTAIQTVPSNAKDAIVTCDIAEAAPVFLTNQGYYNFSIGAFDNAPYSIATGGTKALTSGSRSNTASQWFLEPVNSINVNVGAAGITGLNVDFAVVLPEGLEAYTAVGVTDEAVLQLAKIESDTIPARTPMILRGKPGSKQTLGICISSEEPIETPFLKGTLMRETGVEPYSYYLITSSADGMPTMGTSSGRNISANTVYVPKTAEMPQLADKLTVSFDGVMGIHGVNANAAGEGRTYDLQGREVDAKARGIVIRNGQTRYQK